MKKSTHPARNKLLPAQGESLNIRYVYRYSQYLHSRPVAISRCVYVILPVCLHVLVCIYLAFCGNYCMFSYVPIMFNCASHVMVVYVCSQLLWACSIMLKRIMLYLHYRKYYPNFGILLVSSMYYMNYLTHKYFNRNSKMTELILRVYQVLKAEIKIIFTQPVETAYGK